MVHVLEVWCPDLHCERFQGHEGPVTPERSMAPRGGPVPCRAAPRSWRATAMECKEEGCSQSAVARGWCAMHYARWRKTGDPGSPGRLRRKNGTGTGCWYKGCLRAPEK